MVQCLANTRPGVLQWKTPDGDLPVDVARRNNECRVTEWLEKAMTNNPQLLPSEGSAVPATSPSNVQAGGAAGPVPAIDEVDRATDFEAPASLSDAEWYPGADATYVSSEQFEQDANPEPEEEDAAAPVPVAAAAASISVLDMALARSNEPSSSGISAGAVVLVPVETGPHLQDRPSEEPRGGVPPEPSRDVVVAAATAAAAPDSEAAVSASAFEVPVLGTLDGESWLLVDANPVVSEDLLEQSFVEMGCVSGPARREPPEVEDCDDCCGSSASSGADDDDDPPSPQRDGGTGALDVSPSLGRAMDASSPVAAHPGPSQFACPLPD